MEIKPARSADNLAILSILLGFISILPFVITILSLLIERIFSIHLQWLADVMGWLGSTRLVVYIGWLSLPGLIIGVFARIKASLGLEKWMAVIGIFISLFGILWVYFISSMLRLADYW